MFLDGFDGFYFKVGEVSPPMVYLAYVSFLSCIDTLLKLWDVLVSLQWGQTVRESCEILWVSGVCLARVCLRTLVVTL